MKINDIRENVFNHRIELHKIPELGFCEYKTSEYISTQLQKIGYKTKNIAKTGVIAYKEGIENECIAFRADIDGLSITEETDLSYSSQIDGHMHACGHDGHASILLGFAEYVSKINTLKKGILFIFQPAEEGPGGAEVIVNEGIFKDYNVKNVFGLHIYPEIEQGKIGVRPGAMTAQTGEFDIYIKAKCGHGAIPHKANDALIVVAQLINSYQSIISRNIDPIEGSVLTIGTINGGERRNIIAENISLEGTIRAFSQEVYEKIKERMVTINNGLMEMFGVKIDIVFRDMYPPVINDKELLDKIRNSSLKENLIEIDPMMIAEDFSYYQIEVPGLFFMLGSRNEELKYTNPLHSSKFNFDIEVLMNGVKMYDEICKTLSIY
ncbi:M20 metallopeptidase family protein [Terrisporobacter vanillatitrophus]|uniref:M20 metallopeptidase family protein n=1 Tax=Terrisporobacter vanillatitrophus TaxID=3058402 RepID=UPI0033664F8B